MAHQETWDELVAEVAAKVIDDCIDRDGEETPEQIAQFAALRGNQVLTNVRALALEGFVEDVLKSVAKRKDFIAAQVKARQEERKKAKEAKK